jgi:hypothetical protein
MIEEIMINRTYSNKIRKEWKAEGWQSAHYFTRRGVNVDLLRKQAKAGEIEARVLNTEGVTTWYYKESDVFK